MKRRQPISPLFPYTTLFRSGPAAGVAGAAFVAGLGGVDDVLTFDMGGTSTDVATVLGGRPQVTAESVVAGIPIRLDRKSTRLNSSHQIISYAVFCLKKKKTH